MEDFLHPHLMNNVRMGTDPHAACRHIPQQRIEHEAVAPLGERVDPDEHAVATEKLLPHLVRHIVGIQRGFGFDAECGHRIKYAAEPIVPWRYRMPF
jgi:hypothetical protein